MKLGRKKGFTLIEAILVITVTSIAFLGIINLLANLTVQNIDIDVGTRAIMLAREKMSETTAQEFANIVNVPTTGFGGNFPDYSYSVVVNYVDAADLNTTVPGPTSLKRITVTVTATGRTENIQLFNLKTELL